MKTAPPRKASPGVAANFLSSSGGWGAKAVHKRVPSGIKLVLEPDSDCILHFIGYKDITERVAAKNPKRGPIDEVKYATFFDGRRFVTMPASTYALSEIDFTPEKFYYFHHQGEIDCGNGLNPMKDYEILELGSENEVITCPARVHPSGEIKLCLEAIYEANYTRLNYPLRPAGSGPRPVEAPAS